MTVPDPHSFALSRRALRDRAGRSTVAPADVPTRRSLRDAAGHVPVAPPVFASRAQARLRLAPAGAPQPTPALAASVSASTERRRPAAESGHTPTPIWVAVSRAAQARSTPAEPTAPTLTPPPAVAAAPTAASAKNDAPTPAIFRAPPPPEPVRYVPLLAATASGPARHVLRKRGRPWRLGLATAAVSALIAGGSAAMTASAVTGQPVATVVEYLAAATIPPATASPTADPQPTPDPPAAVAAPIETPAPQLAAAPATVDVCGDTAVMAALAVGDDGATIAAAGGADAFRAAVASGAAPCIDLGDPARVWAVVDKTRPMTPVDYAPAGLMSPDAVRTLESGVLRSDASAAMTAIVAAAAQAGVGEIAVQSAYRSYRTQVTSYGNQVADRGTDGADLVSARPGFSEHQSGLAADVVACDGGCSTFDDLAETAQGRWIVDHAWEYGWIVRYEDGQTPVTGYSPEPWHLRFIGVDLAAAYHSGGWHTLEEFLGLPASPGYAD